MSRWNFIVLFLLIGYFSYGQTFTLTADANKIIQNSTVSIQYKLDGAKGSGFKNPNFGSLELVSGPSQSTSMQIINGAMSQSQSFSYSLFRCILKIPLPLTPIESQSSTQAIIKSADPQVVYLFQ